MGNHSEPHQMDPLTRTVLILITCAVVIVIAIGFAVALGYGPTQHTELTTSLPTPTRSQRPPPTPAVEHEAAAPAKPKTTPKPTGVRGKINAGSVLGQTQYVKLYRQYFPWAAKGHRDEGLASDGAELCNSLWEKGASRSGILEGLIDDEREDGTPVSPKTARAIMKLALEQICPGYEGRWEAIP